MVERAVMAGYEGVNGLGALTPVEIERELEAFAVREQRRWEEMDALAWMTAQYVAVAVGAPRRFPRRPELVRRSRKEMSPEAMRAVFEHLAVADATRPLPPEDAAANGIPKGIIPFGGSGQRPA